jgi:hypothetical protein
MQQRSKCNIWAYLPDVLHNGHWRNGDIRTFFADAQAAPKDMQYLDLPSLALHQGHWSNSNVWTYSQILHKEHRGKGNIRTSFYWNLVLAAPKRTISAPPGSSW